MAYIRPPMRILFLARSLDVGGAERQLVTLAIGLGRRGHDVRVGVFYPGGPLEVELRDAGVPLTPLDKRSRWDGLSFALRLVRFVREVVPEVIHGYLVAPNLATALLRPAAPRAAIVWGLRASDMDFGRYDVLSRITFGASIVLARTADLLVVNSEAGRRFHIASGFPPERLVAIPNGIDVDRFRPDRASGGTLRERWGFGPADVVVGLVARIDPMKDHATFLEAAEAVAQREPRARFVCVGAGPSPYADAVRSRPAARRLGARLVWTGQGRDVAAVYNALDILVLSSAFGEGFPNVVAEAMACGLPCVVTDTGDAAAIVGETGRVVGRGDPVALAAAIVKTLREGPPAPRPEIRERIARHYSVEALCERTETALAPLVARSSA